MPYIYVPRNTLMVPFVCVHHYTLLKKKKKIFSIAFESIVVIENGDKDLIHCSERVTSSIVGEVAAAASGQIGNG